MTPDQAAAVVRARTLAFEVELEMMRALNTERERNGYALAYGEEAFAGLLERLNAEIGWNACVALFNEGAR